MVKRKKSQNSESEDDKSEENGLEIESVVSSEGGELKEPSGSTQTRSKTAQQLQVQPNCNIDENADTADSTDTQKDLTDIETADQSLKSSRTSVRPPKKPKKDFPQPTNVQNTSKPVKPNDKAKTRRSRRSRRSWEVWSKEDIDDFFLALCEFGKDFEKIHSFILQRGKKRASKSRVIKNKDQVRHFYYRTLQKIFKHINIKESINKQAFEICLMINYGELRRKLGHELSEKNETKLNKFAQKFEELIYNGVTYVKSKGRKIKMKTPICRALRRYNSNEDPKVDDVEEIQKFPNEIKVLFYPKDNATWAKIQSLSMNPRVKLNLGLQRRISDVIELLQRRWKPHPLKMRDRLLKGLPSSSHQNMGLKSTEEVKVLKISPENKVSINISNLTICQSESNIDPTQVITMKDLIGSPESNKMVKKAIKSKQSCSSESREQTSVKNELQVASNSVSDCKEAVLQNVVDYSTSDTTKELETVNTQENSCDDSKKCINSNERAILEDNEKSLLDELNLDMTQSGFTAKEAASLTFGQLYLMLDKPKEIVLYYEWISEEKKDTSAFKELTQTLKELVRVASVSLADLGKLKQNALSSGNVIACSCGHICNASAKSNKPPIVPKSLGRSLLGRVNSSKSGLEEGAQANSEKEPRSAEKSDSESFLKPTHVAPRFNALSPYKIAINDNIGLSSLKRMGYNRCRPIRKALAQRTLVPKASSNTPVVTVQLVPSAGLASLTNQNISFQTNSDSGNVKKVVKIMPKAGQLVNVASFSVLNNTSTALSSTAETQINSTSCSSSVVVPSSDNSSGILSSITASIMSDNGNTKSNNTSVVSNEITSSVSLNPPENQQPHLLTANNESVPKLAPHITSILEHPIHSSKGTSRNIFACSRSTNDIIHASSSMSAVALEEDKHEILSGSIKEQQNSSPNEGIRSTSPVLSTNWLDAENSDYSLSSLLSTIESPLKPTHVTVIPSAISILSDNSSLDGIGRLAPDVDTQLQCLMNENSIDYVSKFADLAAHIASSDQRK